LIFSPQAPEAIFGTRACIFYCLSLANADDKLKHVGHVVARFLSRLVANVDDKLIKHVRHLVSSSFKLAILTEKGMRYKVRPSRYTNLRWRVLFFGT